MSSTHNARYAFLKLTIFCFDKRGFIIKI